MQELYHATVATVTEAQTLIYLGAISYGPKYCGSELCSVRKYVKAIRAFCNISILQR